MAIFPAWGPKPASNVLKLKSTPSQKQTFSINEIPCFSYYEMFPAMKLRFRNTQGALSLSEIPFPIRHFRRCFNICSIVFSSRPWEVDGSTVSHLFPAGLRLSKMIIFIPLNVVPHPQPHLLSFRHKYTGRKCLRCSNYLFENSENRRVGSTSQRCWTSFS